MKIKNFTFVYDIDGLSHITCILENKKLFDIECFDFFRVLCDSNQNIKNYADKFKTWDSLLDDLISLEFDFRPELENYINNQFTKEEIDEFTYTEL
jgi:hypothetical protein